MNEIAIEVLKKKYRHWTRRDMFVFFHGLDYYERVAALKTSKMPENEFSRDVDSLIDGPLSKISDPELNRLLDL